MKVDKEVKVGVTEGIVGNAMIAIKGMHLDVSIVFFVDLRNTE